MTTISTCDSYHPKALFRLRSPNDKARNRVVMAFCGGARR